MDFDDFKWFFFLGVVPLAIWGWVSFKDSTNAPAYDFNANAPVVTFVPEGTPGAMSAEEFRHIRFERTADGYTAYSTK